jgi:hypothetical protein
VNEVIVYEPVRSENAAPGGEVVLAARPETPASWLQLALVVGDGSQSMTWQMQPMEPGGFEGSKGAAAGHAVRGLVDRLAGSAKKANFYLANVSFHDAVSHTAAPMPVTAVDAYTDFDPTAHGVGGTMVAAGLEEALKIATQFLAEDSGGLPKSVVVLLLTDGECSQPERTRQAAAALTSDPRIKLACAYFATKGQQPSGLGLLQSIASTPSSVYCRTVYDAETLRDFFFKSVSNPASMPAGAAAGAL